MFRPFSLPLLALALGAVAYGHLRAQEATSAPSPVTEYLGRTVAQTMHWQGAGWLIRHKRDREESAIEMREQLRLKPGMIACDMGSGNG